MFISEKNKKTTLRTTLIYAGITAFVAIFGAVYEMFSHNVFSAHMSFAWLWTLGFGALMYFILFLLPINKVPGVLASSIYNFGVAILTMRSIYIGVIDIYGTARPEMVKAYTVIFHIFLIPGLLFYLFVIFYSLFKSKQDKSEKQKDFYF